MNGEERQGYYAVQCDQEQKTLAALGALGFPTEPEKLLGHNIYVEPSERIYGGLYTSITSLGVRTAHGLVLYVQRSEIYAMGTFLHIAWNPNGFYIELNQSLLPERTLRCTISPSWPQPV